MPDHQKDPSMATLFMALIVLCAPLASAAQLDASFAPNIQPTIHANPASGAIRVDGYLDDPGWQNAAHATNFTETSPGDQVRPPVSTEVLITYSRTHLYVAFKAEASIELIRASLRDRDEIFTDDYVGIVLDTYNNGAWAYELCANPLGVQGDMRWTSDGEDLGFDLVYETRGQITDDGYQIEMAIPFKSLRFPKCRKPEVARNVYQIAPA